METRIVILITPYLAAATVTPDELIASFWEDNEHD